MKDTKDHRSESVTSNCNGLLAPPKVGSTGTGTATGAPPPAGPGRDHADAGPDQDAITELNHREKSSSTELNKYYRFKRQTAILAGITDAVPDMIVPVLTDAEINVAVKDLSGARDAIDVLIRKVSNAAHLIRNGKAPKNKVEKSAKPTPTASTGAMKAKHTVNDAAASA
jgi:hypothetical protein